MTAPFEKLFDIASAARANAYAPYSNFPVGVAIVDDAGNIHAGCNVENAAYPQGWCAETSAISSMVTSGRRKITQVLVVADRIPGGRFCTPCGGCRQKISEFAAPDVVVWSCDPTGEVQESTIAQLLPHAFDLGEQR